MNMKEVQEFAEHLVDKISDLSTKARSREQYEVERTRVALLLIQLILTLKED